MDLPVGQDLAKDRLRIVALPSVSLIVAIDVAISQLTNVAELIIWWMSCRMCPADDRDSGAYLYGDTCSLGRQDEGYVFVRLDAPARE